MSTVYLLPIREAAVYPQERLAAAFPNRLAHARQFLREEDRLRCIGGGALLQGLGLSEADLQTGACGKPFLPKGQLHFNLSHSGDFILLAVDSAPIGADMEVLNPAHLDLAAQVFQPEEQAWMQADPLRRFYTLWTLKESVQKQCGRGLSLAPESFSVLPLLRGESIRSAGQSVFAATATVAHHCIAVCTTHPPEPLAPVLLTAAECLARQL